MNIEVFPSKASLKKSSKKIKVETESTILNATNFLADFPPYTKFRFELMAKSKWALSHGKVTKEFFTSGEPASEPRNFRAFWFPAEKVGTFFKRYWCFIYLYNLLISQKIISIIFFLHFRTYLTTQLL